jgi:hypothetical protein
MAFVKKSRSQQYSSLGSEKSVFVGRASELDFFVERILRPEDPIHNILSISGQGGVGKSTLLLRFIELAQSPDFADSCPVALVDEHQTTITSTLYIVHQ